MAARRLLVLMLVLLGVSTLAAALVGNRPLNEGRTAATATDPAASGTATAPPAPARAKAPERPGGKRLGIEITTEDERVQVVPIRVGDQLALSVSSPRADQVEIPALGLLEPVLPGAPARFELLARQRGDYGVRLVFADRLLARIEVEYPRSASED